MIKYIGALLTVLAISLPSIPARADSASEIADLKRRIEELERKQIEETEKINKKTETLAQEIDATKLGQLIPEKAALKSEYGLGPAASSVYQVKKGLSLGGYGEGQYRNFVHDDNGKKDNADLLRVVAYLGYKFDENIIFNSEIEFEHATTDAIGGDSGDSEGEVSVEFAYMDFMMNQAANARVGLVLVPMGFINEMHEPNTFHGVRRPEVEQVIIPTTWRENGFGLFGSFDAAGKLEYRTYLVNGLRASRFEDSGIREGRQSGNRALFEDVAWTGRIDYSPEAIPGLLVGGSGWFGNSGQDETFVDQKPSVQTLMGEAHAQYKHRNLEVRALGAWGSIDDAELLSEAKGETIGDAFYGWYTEVAYNILPHFSETTHYLAPFFRFEQLDTQASVPNGYVKDQSQDKDIYICGLTYKPIPNVALKLDYRNFQTDGENKTADEVAFGIGFAF